MTSLKLLHLAHRRGSVPSLKGPALSSGEQRAARQGMCVTCGNMPQSDASFRCEACETSESAEDVAADIRALRQRLLRAPTTNKNT